MKTAERPPSCRLAAPLSALALALKTCMAADLRPQQADLATLELALLDRLVAVTACALFVTSA
jgi:hypothetical protein